MLRGYEKERGDGGEKTKNINQMLFDEGYIEKAL